MGAAVLVRSVLAMCLALGAQVSTPRPLAGTYWRAIELDGRSVPSRDSIREAHLVLQEGGGVYGSDGCNRVAGRYELKNGAVRFADMAATRMACIDTDGLDAAFLDALKRARQLAVAGDHLELFDSANRGVAVFLAVSSRPVDPGKR